MLLACPSCSSAFRLPPTAIAAEGRVVRCSNCQHVWTALPADLVPEPELEKALAGAETELVDSAASEAPSLTGDSQLDAEIEAAFAAVDHAYAAAEADDIVAIDRPFEPETMIEADDAPPLAPHDEPAAAIADQPPADKAPPAKDLPAKTPADRTPAADEEPAEEADDQPARAAALSPEDAETLETLRRKRRPLAEKPGPLKRALHIAATVVLLAVAGALIWRSDLVRLSPNLAGFYQALGLTVNLRGLEFHEVTAVRDVKDGIPVLTVEGYVFNPGPKAADISKLRMAVLGSNGRELYAWTAEPAQPMLAAGESFLLRSRLASPPQDGQDVLVRFLLKRDLLNAKP